MKVTVAAEGWDIKIHFRPFFLKLLAKVIGLESRNWTNVNIASISNFQVLKVSFLHGVRFTSLFCLYSKYEATARR